MRGDHLDHIIEVLVVHVALCLLVVTLRKYVVGCFVLDNLDLDAQNDVVAQLRNLQEVFFLDVEHILDALHARYVLVVKESLILEVSFFEADFFKDILVVLLPAEHPADLLAELQLAL